MSDSILTKICTYCQEIKPVSEFNKMKAGKHGVRSQCKSCCSIIYKEYREKNAKKINARGRDYYKANVEKVKARCKIYREENKEKIKKRIKDWSNANQEKIKVRRKAYYKVNAEKINAYGKNYREENRKKCRAASKIYNQTDAGKTRAKKAWHKYRALKLKATVEDFSPTEIFERDNYICQSCGIKTSLRYKNQHHPKRSELDHIVPLSLGGEHSKANTQCLCSRCNRTKNNTGTGDQLRLFG